MNHRRSVVIFLSHHHHIAFWWDSGSDPMLKSLLLCWSIFCSFNIHFRCLQVVSETGYLHGRITCIENQSLIEEQPLLVKSECSIDLRVFNINPISIQNIFIVPESPSYLVVGFRKSSQVITIVTSFKELSNQDMLILHRKVCSKWIYHDCYCLSDFHKYPVTWVLI